MLNQWFIPGIDQIQRFVKILFKGIFTSEGEIKGFLKGLDYFQTEEILYYWINTNRFRFTLIEDQLCFIHWVNLCCLSISYS